MIIQLNSIGSALDTRIEAAFFRRRILSALQQEKLVTLDFTGVKIVSPSFADECFGKLVFDVDPSSIRSSVSFDNASPLMESIFKTSLKERMTTEFA